MRRLLLPLAVCVALGSAAARADLALPLVVTHQGRLLDASDKPVNGPVTFTFTLHSTATGNGSSGDEVLWTGTYGNVAVSDGLYTVVLGSGSWPLPANAFDGERWLGVSINASQELSPRLRLGAAPYAMVAQRALNADRLGGMLAADFAPATGAAGYIWAGTTPQNASLSLGTGGAQMATLDVSGRASLSGGLTVLGPLTQSGDATLSAKLSVQGNTTIGGTLTVADQASFQGGFNALDATIAGRLTASQLAGSTLQLGSASLSGPQLASLAGGPTSNADLLHSHADTGTRANGSSALAPGQSVDVVHGFNTNDVSATLWQSRDGGQSYQLVRPVTPESIDVGRGTDGPFVLTTNLPPKINATATATGGAGSTSLSVSRTAGFAANRKILLLQMQGDGAGRWEENEVLSVGSSSLTLKTPLGSDFSSLGANRAQVISIPEFTDVTIQSTGMLYPDPWDGNIGGVLVFKASGTVTIADGGQITTWSLGYRGGAGGRSPKDMSGQTCISSVTNAIPPLPGESPLGRPTTPWSFLTTNCDNALPNGSGGAAGLAYNGEGMTGGNGGSNATSGSYGQSAHYLGTASTTRAGTTGSDAMTQLFMGGGGGGGSNSYRTSACPNCGSPGLGGDGGFGGGIIVLSANKIVNRGKIVASGSQGQAGHFVSSSDGSSINGGGGGGGAGGTVWLRAFDVDPGFISVAGGRGGNSNATPYAQWSGVPTGGEGGDGRVRIDSLGRQGWVLVQPDKNTVRAVNYTGQTANVRVVVRR